MSEDIERRREEHILLRIDGVRKRLDNISTILNYIGNHEDPGLKLILRQLINELIELDLELSRVQDDIRGKR